MATCRKSCWFLLAVFGCVLVAAAQGAKPTTNKAYRKDDTYKFTAYHHPQGKGEQVVVALTSDGALVRTKDGKTWSEGKPTGLKAPGPFRSLIWYWGLFVAVGGQERSSIAVSLDGQAWEYPQTPDIGPLTFVFHDGSHYIAFASAGQALISGDGYTDWRPFPDKAAEPPRSGWKSCTFGMGTYLLSGADGGCTASMNLRQFAPSQPGPGVLHTAYGKQRFVVFGDGGLRAHSADGSDWRDMLRDEGSLRARDLVWTGSRFLAVADAPGGGVTLYTSDTGRVWERSQRERFPIRLRQINGQKLLGLEDGAVVWSTDGGTTWTDAGAPHGLDYVDYAAGEIGLGTAYDYLPYLPVFPHQDLRNNP